MLNCMIKPRRLRISKSIRDLVSESCLRIDDLIQPVFVAEKSSKIDGFLDIQIYDCDNILQYIDKLLSLKINKIALFPKLDQSLKNSQANEAFNENNIICRIIKIIKEKYNEELLIITDVALDPYTDHGHDGIVKNNKINNRETVELLMKQSLILAKSGADVVAPSDMMDGRIGEIRKYLNQNDYEDVLICSYAVKYNSSLYSPFRDIVGSSQKKPIDKSTYQMDFRNNSEAIKEIRLDIEEGADIFIIKPAIFYLDIIREARNNFADIAIIGYQVSGECKMIWDCYRNNGLIDVVYESLVAIKRSGANGIVTYFAEYFAENRNKTRFNYVY